mgnify:FL=1
MATYAITDHITRMSNGAKLVDEYTVFLPVNNERNHLGGQGGAVSFTYRYNTTLHWPPNNTRTFPAGASNAFGAGSGSGGGVYIMQTYPRTAPISKPPSLTPTPIE